MRDHAFFLDKQLCFAYFSTQTELVRMKKIITQTIVVAFTAGSLMLTTACGGGEDEAAAEADAADAASEAEGDGEEEEPGGE